jgi:hypothetical protein
MTRFLYYGDMLNIIKSGIKHHKPYPNPLHRWKYVRIVYKPK